MYIRVKLDSPCLHCGPATVIAVGLDKPQPNTRRVGEADWTDDSVEPLQVGDRVELGLCAVHRLHAGKEGR